MSPPFGHSQLFYAMPMGSPSLPLMLVPIVEANRPVSAPRRLEAKFTPAEGSCHEPQRECCAEVQDGRCDPQERFGHTSTTLVPVNIQQVEVRSSPRVRGAREVGGHPGSTVLPARDNILVELIAVVRDRELGIIIDGHVQLSWAPQLLPSAELRHVRVIEAFLHIRAFGRVKLEQFLG
mmetsp:Transcript_27682/g.84496  ORF Transcript_27682/g.84496 Transcript_27682/m.84496 type:complete len:179 (+) Transcript_27682:432-968(+)